MDLENWALENAPRVVRDVERHGLTLSWSEAHERLLQIASFMELPAYLDEGNGELVPLTQVESPLWHRRRDFAEDVAGAIVHYEGKIFFPADPAKSSTPIAVPWAVASELVTRLSFLLTGKLGSVKTNRELDAMREIASLVLSLSARVADQMAWIGDDDFTDDRIEGQRYLLMCANEVWRAAVLLRDAAGPLGLDGESSDTGLDDGLGAYLTDRQEVDTFLWELERWITDRAHS